MSNEGWHPHPYDPTTWAYWNGSAWLRPEEALAEGQVPPGGRPPSPPGSPPPGSPPPGWWQAGDGRWYPPQGGGPGPMYGAAATNGLAVASLVLGIVWLWGIGAVLALIFGYRALGQIRRSAGREGGKGLATAGVVLGWIGVVGAVLVTVLIAVTADDYNSDPSDGHCNDDRFWQDPDC